MSHGIKHTKDEIVSGIQEAWQRGEDLRTGSVGKHTHNYSWCFRSYNLYFPSWKDTLSAAGITYEDVKKKVEGPAREARKQELLGEIRAAYEKGVDLSQISLQNGPKKYRRFRDRVLTYFHGKTYWEDALKEAGLPVEKIIRQRNWTKERVDAEIQRRNKDGLPLNRGALDGGFDKAIIRVYGNYRDALEANGLNPRDHIKSEKRYSAEFIISEIKKLHEQKVELNETRMRKSKDPHFRKLYHDSRREIGSWEKTVTAAGVDYSQYRERKPHGYWNKDKIEEEIRGRRTRGEPINCASVIETNNALVRGASRVYGNWSKALTAYGIKPWRVAVQGISLTEDQLVLRIKRLEKAGFDLSFSSMLNSDNSKIRRVCSQSINRFGSWEKALTFAGIDYSSVRKNTKHDLKRIREITRELAESGANLNPTTAQNDERTRWIYRAALKRYDSWRDFLDAVGIDSSKYTKVRFWKDGEGVLEHLRENFDSGVVTGASNDRAFAMAVRTYFGDLKKAVALAGLIYSKSGKLNKGMLEDPHNLEILYKRNIDFVKELAVQTFSGAENLAGRVDEFSQIALQEAVKSLGKKAPKRKVRDFIRERAQSSLNKLYCEYSRDETGGGSTLDAYKRLVNQKWVLLDRKETEELARAKDKGDLEAKELLFNSQLRWVLKRSYFYKQRADSLEIDFMDIVSAGNDGLQKAVEKYSPDKGTTLNTYATYWIDQSIRRALNNLRSGVRVPIHRSAWSVSTKSLDESLSSDPEDGEFNLESIISRDAFENRDRGPDATQYAELLKEALATLDDREGEVIRKRMGYETGEKMAFEDISKQFGVTRERIRQIQNIALKKLRRKMKELLKQHSMEDTSEFGKIYV
jgi:RNA polymerase primary sigma factor